MSRDVRNEVLVDELKGHIMNTAAAECSVNEVPDLDEDEFDCATSIHAQFKDAGDFGKACRSLALSVGRQWEQWELSSI